MTGRELAGATRALISPKLGGLFGRLFARPERRASSFGAGIGLGPITTGNPFAARIAENAATVCACIGAISSTIATLPAYVYRRTDAGRIEAPNHPVARLIRQPNERQTWPDWLEMMISQVLLYGNALSIIEYDGAGRPTALIPVPWGNCLVQLLPNGRMAFDIMPFIAPWGGIGVPTRVLFDDVFLLRDRSDDGYLGRSRLSRAPEVFHAALGIQEYSAAIWRHSATPSGVIKHPAKLSPEASTRLAQSFNEVYSGAHNAKKVAVLEEGMDFTPMSVSPEDAEVLASRRFTVEELCRIYQVPPPIVQAYENNTFTNSQQAATWFAQLTLTPWCRKLEAEFLRSIFADPSGDFHLEIDLSGLMRGDYGSRWQAAQIAIQNGILTPNEIREQEGYNPRPDGNVLRTMPGTPTPGDSTRQNDPVPETVQ